MLAICTHRGVGLCFSDHGWYPRTTEVELDVNDEVTANSRQRGGKIYNKILANLIKTLKVNEDLRQQELALKVLSACPELIAGYAFGFQTIGIMSLTVCLDIGKQWHSL